MTFAKLSPKQKIVFRWCYKNKHRAIICDGAVRSGKTICMITSFILWAMRRFDGATFGICGKTVRSAERNIILPMQSITDLTHYFRLSYARSANLLTIEGCGRKNYFYVFGGKDESSYMLIQGITLCGVLFDEVALMPRSFVDQAIARTLSVENALLWFNCNPEGPQHWFYKEWICKADEKSALHVHFLMSDNPTISQEQLQHAEKQFIGVFHDRYIKGLWTLAEGLVYTMWRDEYIQRGEPTPPPDCEWYLALDYGTYNPFSAGLWAVGEEKAVRVAEYYYDGRQKAPRTDEEHYAACKSLIGNRRIQYIIVDPSAVSFIECVRRHGEFVVRKAHNEVLDGIRRTAALIDSGRLIVHESCTGFLEEIGQYSWNSDKDTDTVVKSSDHAMDDTRYLVNTILRRTLLADLEVKQS